MKRYVLLFSVTFFIMGSHLKLWTMEPEEPKVELKKKLIKKIALGKDWINLGGDFKPERTLFSQGKISSNHYLYLKLKSIEPLAKKSFEELIKDKRTKKLPFVFTVVTSMGKDNKRTVTIYQYDNLNEWLLKETENTKKVAKIYQLIKAPENRYSILFHDPINKQPIIGQIIYYEMPLDSDTPHYLGTDADKFLGNKEVNEFLDTYFKAIQDEDTFYLKKAKLGFMYESGKGVKRNQKKAEEFYKAAQRAAQKAAEKGKIIALTELGTMYQFGKDVPEDLDKAHDLYQQAADKGDTEALINLGFLYQSGKGVKQDYKKAHQLYQEAIDKGDLRPLRSLGILYEFGLGVAQNYKKAFDLYQRAIAHGNVPALMDLGVMYQEGKGVPKDLCKARELYKKAADKGDVIALVNLGTMYERGDGVPQDLNKAKEFYEKAADKNFEPALKKLKELEKKTQGLEGKQE